MRDDFAGDLLKGMRDRVPDKLIQFGRALESASVLVDGWPYFLERAEKWASEYARWTENGSPQEGEDGWAEFMDAIGSVAL